METIFGHKYKKVGNKTLLQKFMFKKIKIYMKLKMDTILGHKYEKEEIKRFYRPCNILFLRR